MTPTTKTITLQGALIPFNKGSLVFLEADNATEDILVPVFSSEDAMRNGLAALGVAFDETGIIEDARDFYQSLPTRMDGHRIRLVVDIHKDGDGKAMWFEPVMN